MPIPPDYASRVYAGVLGKIIGVYLGRPFEGWEHQRILRELGEIRDYVHAKLNVPLIVTDDDITGTFTFVRAMEDFAKAGKNLTAKQVGQTWLNYIIENKTILWWGGMGLSTEHTAYLRLQNGIDAPRSGSMELNGKVVSEQIGAQIFIDAWAMIAPGDPRLAAELARVAATVSHDGEAVYAAQLLAAMESQAFVERDMHKLLDAGLSVIPQDCVIRRLIDDLIVERIKHDDWKKAFADVLRKNYGYDRYGGNCHVVPNHGVVILSLLFGRDSFDESLMIANTCGWDTDCNSGNVGCFMGIKNGLESIGMKWRAPIADRLYLPTADGGSAISDAVRETDRIVKIALGLHDVNAAAPKNGARFHFSYPGSMQGFTAHSSGTRVDNVDGRLRIRDDKSARVSTPTFIPSDAAKFMPGYALLACPTLYSGQTLRASIDTTARIFIDVYNDNGEVETAYVSDAGKEIEWMVPNTGGRPIARVGVEVPAGTSHLNFLTWDGSPDLVLRRLHGSMWQRAWIEAADAPPNNWDPKEDFRLIQNRGRGMLIHGTRGWRNYTVETTLTPHMAGSFGLAARVQGLRRYYAVLVCRDQRIRLIKMHDTERILDEKDFAWNFGQPLQVTLQVADRRVIAKVSDKVIFDMNDTHDPLLDGAIALVVEEGRAASGPVRVWSGT